MWYQRIILKNKLGGSLLVSSSFPCFKMKKKKKQQGNWL